MSCPIFVDPDIERMFDKNIVRTMRGLYMHAELCPAQRLFYFYGQARSGLEDCIATLLKKHDLPYSIMTPSFDAATLKRQITVVAQETKTDYILVVRSAERLLQHRDLLDYVTDLRHTMGAYANIVILTSTAPPQDNAYYEQFDVKLAMKLPTSDFLRQIFEYYFQAFSKWWSGSKCQLGAEDYEELATCVNYCTTQDVIEFCQRVARHVLEAHPEERIDVTMDLLRKFMVRDPDPALADIPDVYVITDREPGRAQQPYDTSQVGALAKKRRLEE